MTSCRPDECGSVGLPRAINKQLLVTTRVHRCAVAVVDNHPSRQCQCFTLGRVPKPWPIPRRGEASQSWICGLDGSCWLLERQAVTGWNLSTFLDLVLKYSPVPSSWGCSFAYCRILVRRGFGGGPYGWKCNSLCPFLGLSLNPSPRQSPRV